MRMEREIKIAKEISEESFKMEALPLEDVEMLEAVEDGLSMVLASVMISLNLTFLISSGGSTTLSLNILLKQKQTL